MKNDHQLTEYLNQLAAIKLTDSARARMQEELMDYTILHDAPENVRVPASGRSIERTFIWMSLSLSKFTFMPYILIFTILLGGGTSLAAQGAVPGDLLYPVKTEINEPVRSAFTFGADAEASYQAKLITERLREADELEVAGALSGAVATTLATNLRDNVAKASAALADSTRVETRALADSIVRDLERFNLMVKNDTLLAFDLNTFGSTQAAGSFASSLATSQLSAAELRTMAEARLVTLTELMTEAEGNVSAEDYAQFTANLDRAATLYTEAETKAEAAARASYDEISELLGSVEARLSTLGTFEFDADTGEVTGIDFSRVPAASRSSETWGSVGVEGAMRGSVQSDESTTSEPAAHPASDSSIEIEADTNSNVDADGAEVDANASGAARSGLSL